MKTMKPITVTLKKIRKGYPCEMGWEKLLKSLGKTKADTEPLKLVNILESNGVEDAIWCLRCMHKKELYLGGMFAAACAEAGLAGVKNPDKRAINGIRAARRCSLGLCSKGEAARFIRAADAARADLAVDYAACSASPARSARSIRAAEAARAVYAAAAAYYAAAAARAARSADYAARADLADYTAYAAEAADAAAIFRSYFGAPKTKKQYIKMFKLETKTQ